MKVGVILVKYGGEEIWRLLCSMKSISTYPYSYSYPYSYHIIILIRTRTRIRIRIRIIHILVRIHFVSCAVWWIRSTTTSFCNTTTTSTSTTNVLLLWWSVAFFLPYRSGDSSVRGSVRVWGSVRYGLLSLSSSSSSSSRVRSEREFVRVRVGCAGYGMVRLLDAAVGTWIGVAVVVEFDPLYYSCRSISLTSCSCSLLLLNSIHCTTRSVSISRPVRVLLSPSFLLYYWQVLLLSTTIVNCDWLLSQKE